MKKLFTHLLLCMLVGLSTAAEAQIIFDGSPGINAPPTTLGPYTMTTMVDSRLDYQSVAGASSPISGQIGFSPNVTTRTVSQTWVSWSHGYAGRIYYSAGQSLTLTMPANTEAFYMYIEPDNSTNYKVIATTNDSGTSDSITVNGSEGANYFGFYTKQTGLMLQTITISVGWGSNGFGIGEFGISQRCDVPIIPTLTASGGGVVSCNSPLQTLTAGGGSSYAFTGPGLSQSGPAATAVVTQVGTYTVIVSDVKGCPARIAATTITRNTAPPSVSISPPSTTIAAGQRTILTAVAGAGFTYKWSNTQTTAAISVAVAGTYSVTATGVTPGCSNTAIATVTVMPTTLSVLSRDPDNGQLGTNTLKPYLQLQNSGTQPIPYSRITVRYWLTVETPAPLLFSVNYAQVGSDRVHLTYTPLVSASPGASGYIEFSFDGAAGSLSPGSNSGPIQGIGNKQDYSYFNQGDDYSYANNASFTANARITAYLDGMLVWGQEPGPVMAVQSLKAYAQNNTGPDANTINPVLAVGNDGSLPIKYGDISMRYYFTADGSQPLNVTQMGYVALGSTNVTTQLVKLTPALANADTYLEVRFSPGLGSLMPGANTGNLIYELRKSDYSGFDQRNDHSYQGTGSMALNGHVVVYVAGQRIYGTEPGAGARLGAVAPEAGLRVRVVGNPVRASMIVVDVSGAEGQPLHLQVTDLTGRIITDWRVERAGTLELPCSSANALPAGLLLLRVSTPTQSQTVKVMNVE